MIPAQKPFIIPLFLPHAGCPHHCIFCNQKTLHPESGKRDLSMLRRERDRWLAFPRDFQRPVELAFFGGNFLGLPPGELEACMELVQEVPGAGLRFSTRPDTVNRASLERFRASGLHVTAELGIQSLDERVLRLSARGHGVDAVVAAFKALKQAGIRVGAQMMTGLPGASASSDLETAAGLVALGPDFARVSPALVLKGSGLAKLYARGRFRPLEFSEAVERTAAYVNILEKGGVPVVRIGLQADTHLEESLLAGPHHPSLGEWVRGRILGDAVLEAFGRMGGKRAGQPLRIRVSSHLRSRMQGMERSNVSRFEKAFFPAPFSIVTEKNQGPDFWIIEYAGGLFKDPA
ncbi:radical SAM family protein [Desulfobotulus alkaliphilus]|uniref:Radical SAM family protein n=1 Tax=Desulfobotulus alkaliphilus TaxID=622671 RepID=A0A562S4K8_9BACT|nr:radical SAM protein [Desulfobotulus alkaliphilus]TWI75620.1 radical SAM family protein [Desulfobotulus alkaliphilus]